MCGFKSEVQHLFVLILNNLDRNLPCAAEELA